MVFKNFALFRLGVDNYLSKMQIIYSQTKLYYIYAETKFIMKIEMFDSSIIISFNLDL